MMGKKLTNEEYIALLEKRDEESRRSIRTLSSLLTSAMDRIEETQKTRRKPKRESVSANVESESDEAITALPVFLDSVDIAEILKVSKSTALKFIKAAGGAQINSRWKISVVKFDEFVSSGGHIDLS